MGNYCVNKNAQNNGDHEVHNVSAACSFLPDPANRLALGYHAYCSSAVQSATAHYAQVNGCAYCAPDCHTG